VHFISAKKLREFWDKRPDAESALRGFQNIVEHTNFDSFADLRRTFPSADQVGKLTVFNIGGQKYRLIAAIHYNTQKFYVRYILTHQDYDRIHWQDG